MLNPQQPSSTWVTPSPSSSTTSPHKSLYMPGPPPTSHPTTFGLPPGTPTSPTHDSWSTIPPPVSQPMEMYLSRYPTEFSTRVDDRVYGGYPVVSAATATETVAGPGRAGEIDSGYYRKDQYAGGENTRATTGYSQARYVSTTEDDVIPIEQSAARKKMKRFRLTHQQTRFLMSEFAKQPHPDATHRENLSRHIPGFSPRQVQVWFQNRRAKIKRLNTEDRDRMLHMRAVPNDFDNISALHNPYGANNPLHPPVPVSTMSVDFAYPAVAMIPAKTATTVGPIVRSDFYVPRYQEVAGDMVAPVSLEYGYGRRGGEVVRGGEGEGGGERKNGY